MLGKIRIYELARELKLSTKETLKALRGLGVKAASHSSTIDQTEADALRRHLAVESPAPAKAAKKTAATRKKTPSKSAKRAAPSEKPKVEKKKSKSENYPKKH